MKNLKSRPCLACGVWVATVTKQTIDMRFGVGTYYHGGTIQRGTSFCFSSETHTFQSHSAFCRLEWIRSYALPKRRRCNRMKVTSPSAPGSSAGSSSARQPLLAGQGCSSSTPPRYSHDDDEGVVYFDDEIDEEGVFYVHDGSVYPSTSADSHVREVGIAFRSTSFGMAVDHPLREWCVLTMCDKRLDNAALAVIMLNSLYMLFEPPVIAPGSPQELLSDRVEWASMIFFTFEMVIKMIACGLVRHEGAFLHDPWNLLDVVVV